MLFIIFQEGPKYEMEMGQDSRQKQFHPDRSVDSVVLLHEQQKLSCISCVVVEL